MVHRLCQQRNVPMPLWIWSTKYVLTEPWFVWPGSSLRVWQLVESPPEFKMRNVFAGDNTLSRA